MADAKEKEDKFVGYSMEQFALAFQGHCVCEMDTTSLLECIKCGGGINAPIEGPGWSSPTGRPMTMLQMAIEKTMWQCVKDLVQGGADANVVDEHGYTCLHHAVMSDRTDSWPGEDVISSLITEENINKQTTGSEDTSYEECCTPLQVSCWCHIPVLVRHGADIMARGELDDIPLHQAIWKGDCGHDHSADREHSDGDETNDDVTGNLKLLLPLINDETIDVCDDTGANAICNAVRCENWDLAELLIKKGSSVNVYNAATLTDIPLVTALERDCPPKHLIKLLLPDDATHVYMALFSMFKCHSKSKRWLPNLLYLLDHIPCLIVNSLEINTMAMYMNDAFTPILALGFNAVAMHLILYFMEEVCLFRNFSITVEPDMQYLIEHQETNVTYFKDRLNAVKCKVPSLTKLGVLAVRSILPSGAAEKLASCDLPEIILKLIRWEYVGKELYLMRKDRSDELQELDQLGML